MPAEASSLAPEYQKKIQAWLDECEISEPAYEDYLEFDQDYMLGLATILKEVVRLRQRTLILWRATAMTARIICSVCRIIPGTWENTDSS